MVNILRCWLNCCLLLGLIGDHTIKRMNEFVEICNGMHIMTGLALISICSSKSSTSSRGKAQVSSAISKDICNLVAKIRNLLGQYPSIQRLSHIAYPLLFWSKRHHYVKASNCRAVSRSSSKMAMDSRIAS